MDHPKKVRNIPIFVESTNQILINKDDETDSFQKTTNENDLKRNLCSSTTSDSSQAKSYSDEDMTTQKFQPQVESIIEPEDPAPATTTLFQQHPHEQKHLESSIEKIQAIQVISILFYRVCN